VASNIHSHQHLMGLALMAVAHAENGVHSPQIFYLNTGELQTSSVHICCKQDLGLNQASGRMLARVISGGRERGQMSAHSTCRLQSSPSLPVRRVEPADRAALTGVLSLATMSGFGPKYLGAWTLVFPLILSPFFAFRL